MNEYNQPDDIERLIMRTFANAVQTAVLQYQFSLQDFLEKAVTTEIFEYYLDDYSLYSQSSSCIVGKIQEELKRADINIKTADEKEQKHNLFYADAGYWLGYMLIYWKIADKVTAKELSEYDFSEIIWSYDVLHTQSVSYALRQIKEEYRKELEYESV